MKYTRIMSVILLVLAVPVSGLALDNPAAVYCTAMGYEYTIEKTDMGDRGFCRIDNGQQVEAWAFFQGKVAREKNYCATKGYGQKIVKDPEKCIKFLSDSCLMCVLRDGQEVEVTELMGLTLVETTCGDSVCGLPENSKTCPKDCPSGALDGYCDGALDHKCDPDCTAKQDPDCPKKKQ